MEEFLKEFGDYYGYPDGPKNIKEIRENEFKRLDEGLSYSSRFLGHLLFLESCVSTSLGSQHSSKT